LVEAQKEDRASTTQKLHGMEAKFEHRLDGLEERFDRRLDDIKEDIGRVEAKTSALDSRVRTVEVKSAVGGAIVGGAVSLAMAWIQSKMRGN